MKGGKEGWIKKIGWYNEGGKKERSKDGKNASKEERNGRKKMMIDVL